MRSVTISAIVIAAFSSLVGSQSIDPNSVPLSTRNSWCQDQRSSCPLLCLQTTNSATTTSNSCDATTLNWSCVCKNGLTPNATEYSLTIPYHICQESGNQCVSKCGQDNACSNNCRTQYTCGASDPTKVNSSSVASSATSTGGSAMGTGNFGTFGSSGSGSSSTNGATVLGQSLAAGVLAFAVVGGMMFSL